MCECVGESVTIWAGVPRFAFAQFVCSGRDTATKKKKEKEKSRPRRSMLIKALGRLHGYQVAF